MRGTRCRACRRPDNKRPGVALQAPWWWQRDRLHGAPTVTSLTPSVYQEAICAYRCAQVKDGSNINIFVVEHQKCKQEASREQRVFLSHQDGQLVAALFWLQPLSAAPRHALYPPPARSSHEAPPVLLSSPCCGRRISTQS